LAEQDFNDYLDELGADWNLDVIIEDSATSPVIALDKLTSLNAKNIHIVIGPQSSVELRNIMGYAYYNGMLLVSSGSTTPTLAIPDDNVYRFIPDDTTQGRVLARMVHDEGITNIIPIWGGDAWGDGLKDVFTKEFTEFGGNVWMKAYDTPRDSRIFIICFSSCTKSSTVFGQFWIGTNCSIGHEL